MRIWDEYGDETDASIALRSFAVWILQVANLAAELLIFRFAPRATPWPWPGVALLVPATYGLAFLVFFTSPPRDRLVSAAKCTGQTAVMLLLLAWVSGGDATPTGWFCLTLMAVVTGLRMWRDGRAVRAEERAMRDRLGD
ncbi:hypothetical protein [Actinomadura opuntiae]|uniref:hypothetical protein n=1 Tax=Actinomadura sp. OS1-43 TaxID=604315 RepID=UPI00255B338A|nr:hypothetical protein [Actinomadura sp. OS1-43]MDL4817213.1 hypothetical protein [Actinomadura sp. OS1-43]